MRGRVGAARSRIIIHRWQLAGNYWRDQKQVTKHCSRDKESVAESHRNAIIGTRPFQAPTSAWMLLVAAAVVNLARLYPVRQSCLQVLDSGAVFMVIRCRQVLLLYDCDSCLVHFVVTFAVALTTRIPPSHHAG